MVSPRIAWVAIEGPCCAGKTTLGDGLLERLGAGRAVIIPDYADYVGGGPCMPDPEPASLPDELAALDFLLDVERRRFDSFLPALPPPIVLIDRSVLTLSAHCSGLDAQHPDRDPFRPAADELIRGDPRPRWPQFVLYLDVSHPEQLSRNDGTFAADSVFLQAPYNAGFRSHFADPGFVGIPLAWIESERPVAGVLDEAVEHLRGWGLVGANA
jgi:hypothetical protein